jgi:hypothetical protein
MHKYRKFGKYVGKGISAKARGKKKYEKGERENRRNLKENGKQRKDRKMYSTGT